MPAHSLAYHTFVARNDGYVSPEAQESLRHLRVLIAGCGIGSSFAEVAIRMGIEHIILADGDKVSETNLNRQFFGAADVDCSKVGALARRLRAINPNAEVTEVEDYLGSGNTASLVSQADLVFDTIDFLDLAAIVGLHDECRRQQKAIITAIAIGWGGGCLYFPAGGRYSFRLLFGLPESGPVDDIPYTVAFAGVLRRLAPHLDPTVVSVVGKALTVMEDGRPCPASQVAPGAFAVAALAGTLVHRIIAGQDVTQAPQMIVADMSASLTHPGINLLE